MFANLKNKLLEEVKSSQAFNSIASAAQVNLKSKYVGDL